MILAKGNYSIEVELLLRGYTITISEGKCMRGLKRAVARELSNKGILDKKLKLVQHHSPEKIAKLVPKISWSP